MTRPVRTDDTRAAVTAEEPSMVDLQTALPPVLTIEEAARVLRISRASAYRAAAAGELPGAFRIGKTLRVFTNRMLSLIAGPVSPQEAKRR